MAGPYTISAQEDTCMPGPLLDSRQKWP